MDLSQLTPDQKRQVMIQAQMEANQSLRQALMEKMTKSCFEKCAGTSGDRLDNREQACMASCQDRYLEVREQVMKALEKRQENM
mmetsp:Transcript_24694/g.35429  ORF Transcript_24694/g.35429 Transcript_24694/m.35429 type:complete len:84 (+) Transcript_24694:61-312(+)